MRAIALLAVAVGETVVMLIALVSCVLVLGIPVVLAAIDDGYRPYDASIRLAKVLYV